MRYFAVKDGIVVAVAYGPNDECPHSTTEPVDCGWLYANGVLSGTANAQAAAIAAGIAGIYAPVAYGGKLYPVDPESMAKYEMAKQSRVRGKMSKAIAIATDGSVTKLSTPQAIDDFHAAMESAVTTRVAAIHDSIT